MILIIPPSLAMKAPIHQSLSVAASHLFPIVVAVALINQSFEITNLRNRLESFEGKGYSNNVSNGTTYQASPATTSKR